MTPGPDEPRPRVLIVDDEPANIHVLAEALKNECEIRFATDAIRALEMAFQMPFDLILLDVVMPGMDGHEILRRLKEAPATHDVPVIFVTARNEIDDEERGLALGAVDYITKPVRAPIVRARARTHIELKRQRNLLERHAFLDGLTNIYNRRRFDEELERRWNVALRNETPITLMLLDVDHFKQFNDTYGHGPGDDCLRRVASALARTFARGDDFVSRYGGEEFALILPGGDSEALARRALAAINALAIPHRASDCAPHVTASIGAFEFVPSHASDPQQALQVVDRLLYNAKQGGRNQCALTIQPGDTHRTLHA